MNHEPFPRRAHQEGSAILAALAVLAVTLVVVGSALSTARHCFRTSHHSSRWLQAGNAAEAGSEIALLAAQSNSWVADGWSAAPGAPGTAAVTKSLSLSTGATGVISTTVAVDKISMGSSQWLRIRSTGIVEIAGGGAAVPDQRDTMLRKLSLLKDRKTGASVTTPRATRTCEILAAPKPHYPFKYTFFSKSLFDIHTNTTTDSYDTSDPAKSNFTPFSTYGVYDASKKQNNGDVGTLGTGAWNFNSAHIWGDVHSPSGSVANASNVHGTVLSGASITFPVEVSPAWTTVTTNHGAVNNVSKTFSGGTEGSPTKHKFTSLKLDADNKSIRVTNPAGQTESWVEIWVEGDVNIAGKPQTGIKIDPGVHATIHFGSKVEILGGGGGYALSNDSQRPSNLVIRAYGGNSGTIQDFVIAHTGFWGVVSAPWYKVKFDMAGKHVHGSFLAWQFDASDGTNLHYDESLTRHPHGVSSQYVVKSWVEAVR